MPLQFLDRLPQILRKSGSEVASTVGPGNVADECGQYDPGAVVHACGPVKWSLLAEWPTCPIIHELVNPFSDCLPSLNALKVTSRSKFTYAAGDVRRSLRSMLLDDLLRAGP